jgi:hypothetical protein
MSKKVKYTVEDGFVKIWFEGANNADIIADTIAEIVKDNEKKYTSIRVLGDARRATFDGKPADLNTITRKFKEHGRKFESIKLAMVLQNPYETAISIILKAMLKEFTNTSLNVFSTEHAAVEWLKDN